MTSASAGRCRKNGASGAEPESSRGAQMTRPSTSPSLRWVAGSKGRSDSTTSPKRSMRTGICAFSGVDVKDAAAERIFAGLFAEGLVGVAEVFGEALREVT